MYRFRKDISSEIIKKSKHNNIEETRTILSVLNKDSIKSFREKHIADDMGFSGKEGI